MKDIVFLKVGFCNYMCYTEPMEYEFHNGKIQLIVGSNGTGKSSLFSALPVCLYGVNPKGVKGEDLVNNKVKKDCYLFSEFMIDEDHYLVRRTIKHSKEGDTVLLYKNGELIKKGHREVVPAIESILMPADLFNNLLYFSQNGKLFMELNDAAQKEIFKKVLDLDLYLKFYENATAEIATIDNDVSDYQTRISVLSEMVDSLNQQLKDLEDKKIEFLEDKKNQLLTLNRLKNGYEEELEKAENKLKESGNDSYTDNINDLQNQIKDIENQMTSVLKKEHDSKIDEINTKKELKISEFREKFNDEKHKFEKDKINQENIIGKENVDEINNLHKSLQEMNSTRQGFINEKRSLESTIKSLHKELTDIKTEIQKEIPKCYTCGQDIGKVEIDKIKEIFRSKNGEYTTQRERVNELESEIDKLNKSIEEESKKIEVIDNTVTKKLEEIESNYKTLIEGLTRNFNIATSKINEVVTNKCNQIDSEYKVKITDLFDKRTNLEKELDRIVSTKSDIDNLKESVDDRKRKIIETTTKIDTIKVLEFDDSFKEKIRSNLESKISELAINEEALIDAENTRKIYEFWKTGFSMKGIPSALIDEAIPLMNERVDYYLNKIGGRYKVSFDTVSETKTGEIRDKINVNVFDTESHADSRKQLSGGQTRIIDIAIILTLRDLQFQAQGCKINIILLDEIFDSLDEENIGVVANLLKLLVGDQSFNIISHRHIDQIEYDEIYRTA